MSVDEAESGSAVPFVDSGSYPVRGGNVVRPLIDGEPAFRRVCEAIENARHSVWAAVTFMHPTFVMPDGRGSALDVLDGAAERGVDVRVIFWRPGDELDGFRPTAFWGSPDQVEMLEARRSGIRIRWDRAHPGFAQHQKCWLIDAGTGTETAILGGINLNPRSMVSPGHAGEGHAHDVYVELTGPAVVDVHHNFVQRWNEASERHASDGRWGAGSENDLAFPDRVPEKCGAARVQIQRTVHAGRYKNGQATPGGVAFDIAAGELSNFDQYRAAIGAARRTIYMENQHVDVPEIVACLDQALRRGVEVVLVMPADPEHAADPDASAERRAFLDARAALGGYPNFTLAGLAGLGADGRRKPVYVHAKLMLVDDAWATVGSCNLHRYSLFGNCELNAAFHDADAVGAMRAELFREHLGMDTSGIDDRTAHLEFKRIALENRRRLDEGNHAWQGLAFRLDPATYERRSTGAHALAGLTGALPTFDKSV